MKIQLKHNHLNLLSDRKPVPPENESLTGQDEPAKQKREHHIQTIDDTETPSPLLPF